MKGSPSAWSPGAYPPPTTRSSRPGPQAPSPACGSQPLPLGLKPPRSSLGSKRSPLAPRFLRAPLANRSAPAGLVRPPWERQRGFTRSLGSAHTLDRGWGLGPAPLRTAAAGVSGHCARWGERRAPVPCSAGLVRRCPPVERGPRACHSLPPLSVLALRPWCLRGRREVRCQTRVRANPDPAPLKPRTQSPKRTRAHGAAAPRLCRLGRRRWGQRP